MAEVHGNRTPAENTGKTGAFSESGAESGAIGAQEPAFDVSAAPDLARLIDAWPTLPEAINGRMSVPPPPANSTCLGENALPTLATASSPQTTRNPSRMRKPLSALPIRPSDKPKSRWSMLPNRRRSGCLRRSAWNQRRSRPHGSNASTMHDLAARRTARFACGASRASAKLRAESSPPPHRPRGFPGSPD